MTDIFNQCPKHPALSKGEGKEIKRHVITGLVVNRNDECFDLLRYKVMKKKNHEALILQKGKFHHDTIFTVMNISITVLNHFIANIILMLLTMLLEILKNDFINPIIRFVLNSRILSQKLVIVKISGQNKIH